MLVCSTRPPSDDKEFSSQERSSPIVLLRDTTPTDDRKARNKIVENQVVFKAVQTFVLKTGIDRSWERDEGYRQSLKKCVYIVSSVHQIIYPHFDGGRQKFYLSSISNESMSASASD
jgi:hypothetical protein